MKPKDKILTYDQAKELKWFCQNVTGVRVDMYKVLEDLEQRASTFENRIIRLEATCALIESFLGTKPTPQGEQK